MQLGAGLLSDRDWADIMTLIEGAGEDSQLDALEGSHGCRCGEVRAGSHEDNAACASLFCLVWESKQNNISRQMCHALSDINARAPEDVRADIECICFPGSVRQCTLGRSHHKHKDVHDGFFEHFNAIRLETGAVRKGTKLTNKHGKCPFGSKEIIPISKLGSLNEYLNPDKVDLLIKHINLLHRDLMHGVKMEELTRFEYTR